MAEYIDREALEVELNHRLAFLMAENGEYDHYTTGYEEAVCTVEDFQSADVAPVVHGHYVINDDGDASCSVCREEYLNHTQNYCPNCGAKLDGEGGESDGTKS